LLALVYGAVACSTAKKESKGQAELRAPNGVQAESAQSNSAEPGAMGPGEAANPSGVQEGGSEADGTATMPDSGSSLSEAGGSARHALSSRSSPRFSPGSAGSASQVQMRNVDFHIDDSVILHIKSLRGAIAGKSKRTPPAFDDKHSFILTIDKGTVGITTASLTEVMNEYVFNYPHAPIKKIAITADGNKLRLKGTVHKVVDIHFEIAGGLNATSDGKISLHPSSIKADGLPVKRLMHLFGVELAGLTKQGNARGVEIKDDDLIIDPNLIIPAPEIKGSVASVRIEGDRIMEEYGGTKGGPRQLIPYDRGAPNYMYFRGGTIRFGKLTMANADMQIVDSHPKGAFDFSIDHYNQQLVAGYSKNTPRYGLVVFMPDYYQVKRELRPVEPR
jgi:hypothetical protein